MAKTEISGYELSRNWFDWCYENPEKVKPIHAAVYFFIIEHYNRLGRKEKFGLPSGMTMDAIGVKNYKTYSKGLNDLIDWGFIRLIQKSQNQYSSCIIALVRNTKANTKALSKASLKHCLKQVQSTVVIDKPKNYRTKDTPKRVGVCDISFEKLGESFNTHMAPPMRKIILPISEKRKKAIQTIADEYGKEKIVEMFSIALKSKFLQGGGKGGWVASFDWMFEPENFVNILEGSYLGSEKKDVVTKADKAYLERIKKMEDHEKWLDGNAKACTLPPKGLSINRIDTK